METIIVCIILIILLLLTIYLLIRNNFVYNYLTDMNDRCYTICRSKLDELNSDDEESFIDGMHIVANNNVMYKTIMRKTLSYNKLFFSFKPLKDKYWLSDEQLKFINLYNK